jgi:hypothetical protein
MVRYVRERAQQSLDRIPEYQRELARCEQTIRTSSVSRPAGDVDSDSSGLHYQRIQIQNTIPSDMSLLHRRVRKLREKIASAQRKGRHLEEVAVQKARQAAELQTEVVQLMTLAQARKNGIVNQR